MDARFDLVRRAQSGDYQAGQALIERNQATVFRLCLGLLEDPEDALRATVETFRIALSSLDGYHGAVAFSTWLYPFAVEVCQRQLKRRDFKRRVSALFGRGTRETEKGATSTRLSDRQMRLAQAVSRLEPRLRLPLVLRYDQALRVEELAPMLGLRGNVAQARLAEARQRMRAALGDPLPAPPADEPGSVLSHRQARILLEAAADHLIVDADDARLRHHLKHCEDCQAVARHLEKLEEELSATFHRAWDGQTLPPGGIAPMERIDRHVRLKQRRVVNWLGALLAAGLTMAVVLMLPNLAPATVVALPATPTPVTQASPTPAARTLARRGTFDWPIIPPLKNTPGLLAKVPGGRLAFITDSSSSHLEIMNANGSKAQALNGGISQSSDPAWSPDGAQIAYLSQPSLTGSNQVFVVNADGSNPHQVSHDDFPPGQGSTQSGRGTQAVYYPLYGPPQWSPDGQWIAAPLWADASTAYLALLSPQGGAVHYLPVAGTDNWLMAWSPDGHSLAYATHKGGGLWLWQPDQSLKFGLNPRQISQSVAWDNVYGLAWSQMAAGWLSWLGTSTRGIWTSLCIFLDRMANWRWRFPSLPIATSVSCRASAI